MGFEQAFFFKLARRILIIIIISDGIYIEDCLNIDSGIKKACFLLKCVFKKTTCSVSSRMLIPTNGGQDATTISQLMHNVRHKLELHQI